MLSRYSRVRMEVKRHEIAACQRAAGQRRKDEAERQQAAVVYESMIVK
jgi:hypothetical protein